MTIRFNIRSNARDNDVTVEERRTEYLLHSSTAEHFLLFTMATGRANNTLRSEALPTQLIFKQIRQKCCRNSANLFRDYYKHTRLVGSVQLSYVDRDYIHIVFNIRLTATKLTYIYYK